MQVVPGRVRLELACGGHPLPLVVHPDGARRAGRAARHAARLRRRAAARPTSSSSSSQGDVLVLYTDGVTEVRRRRREVFGTAQLIELLQTLRRAAARRGGRARRAGRHARLEGRLRDDMAVLALGPDPGARATPPHPEESDG